MARTLLRVPVGDGEDDYIEVEVENRDLVGVELVSDDGAKPERAPFTIGGETGLIFTKGTAEANFTVTVTWRKPARSEGTGNGRA
jgi:hypothetical protein